MPTRVYKFLEKPFALKTLYERRFKISKLEELNDPFDLMPFDMSHPAVQQAMTGTRRDLGKKVGLICFSAKCTDPVIWAHYSGKHTGMCLGFDVPDPDDPQQRRIERVQYVDESLQFPLDFKVLDVDGQNPIIKDMLYTKFKHWAYEEEVRLWAFVTDEEDGMCYADFDHSVTKLAEVIVGAGCTTPKKAIERALEIGGFTDVTIRKMRPASKGFSMEYDQNW